MKQRCRRGWALWRVRVLLLLARPQAALKVLDQLLHLHPEDPQALATRAHVLASLGETDGALLSLKRLLAAQPGHAPAWFNAGFLHEANGEPAAAEAAFRHALAIDLGMDRAWYGLGLALIQLHRLDEAAQALTTNTELQPMSPFGWYQLARVELERGKPQETRRIIRHLQGFEPRVAAQLQRETGLCAELA